MSSRSKRAKHTEPEATTSSRRTTTTTTSHSERRRQRSVSPFNISRNEEKEELAHLNDRLASYIDYVRKLELDKENLKRKIKTFSEERLVSPQTNYPVKFVYSFWTEINLSEQEWWRPEHVWSWDSVSSPPCRWHRQTEGNVRCCSRKEQGRCHGGEGQTY